MPDLDDLIRDHLERTARPPQPDQRLFQGIDKRRAQRATRRRVGSGMLAVVILAGFAVVAFALSRSSGGAAPASLSTPPSVAPVSPNGAIVVVFTDARGGHSLWSLTPVGTQSQLTSGPNDLQPAVNAAGDRVAFSRTERTKGGGGSGLYVVPIEGGRISRLLDPSWFASDPSWSPDGTEIAFAGGGHLIGQSLTRPSGIYVASADGKEEPRLVYAGKTDLAVEGHPSWSPDGSKLVFQAANAALSNPPNFDLYVINSDGSGSATDITNTPESETGPAWSPDGRRIAFSLQPAAPPGVVPGQLVTPLPSRGNIATIALDGTDRVLLTDFKALDVDPAWSPDGELIVFSRTNQSGAASYILEVSTTGRPQTVSTSINGSDPFWHKASGTTKAARPPGYAFIRGLGYPVCYVSSVSADFVGPHGIAYLFSKPMETCSPVAGANNAFLALDRRGNGRPADVTVWGAIHCGQDCRVFGAPDLDGDGRAELAIVVVRYDTGADSIELYKVVPDNMGQPVFKQVTDAQGQPVYTDWGGIGNYRSGVQCQYASSLPSSPPTLNFWRAERKRGVWHLVERFGTMSDSTIMFGRTVRAIVPSEAALPQGPGADFCGVRVRP